MKILCNKNSNNHGPTLSIGGGSAVLNMSNIMMVRKKESLVDKDKREIEIHKIDVKASQMGLKAKYLR